MHGLQVPDSKWCPGCSTLLPADSFWRRSSTISGLSLRCIKCAGVREAKARRQRAASPPQVLPAVKRCGGSCGRVLPLAAFNKDARTADRHCGRCRRCTIMLDRQQAVHPASSD